MKNKWMRIVSFVLVVIVLFAGYYVYSMFSFLDTVSTNKPFSVADANVQLETAKWEGTEQVNILIMGVDRRDPNERPRSDTMLLASIDPITKHMTLFSIMRDTYVNIPGYGQSKINAAFADGGPELMVKTVSSYLDIPIHYYLATDFNGFAKIIDSIGGVDVNVKEKMVHADDGVHDILLQPGLQHMDGYKALQYVRYRGTARADFDRTERQREMLTIVANELKSPGQIIKLPSILKDITPYVQTNIEAGDMYSLVQLGLSLDGKIGTEQLPPNEMLEETSRGNEAVLVPDLQRVRQYVKERTTAGTTGKTQTASTGTSDSNGGQSDNGPSDSETQSPVESTPSNENESAQPAKQSNGPTGKVSGEYVNIRQKPGTEFPVIGQLYKGSEVSIEGTLGDWYYVQTSDGMMGYIKADLLVVE